MTRRSVGWIVVLLFGSVAGSSLEAQDRASIGPAIEGLKAKGVDVRRDSALKIRSSGREAQREALPALIEVLMKEKDGQVRLAALDAVTALGPDAEAAVPALLHTLRTSYGGQSSEESHQDYRSSLALASIGKPAVEGLRGLLKERKESVRAEVVMALGRIGPDAGSAVPDLVPFLGDPSERLRREASQALGRIGLAAIDPLISASTNPDPILRASAVEGLGRVAERDERIERAVLALGHDPTPRVRAAALETLARLKLPDEALTAIAGQTLKDEDDSVRLAAVHLLVARRTLLIRMIPDLEALLIAEDASVADRAAFLLGDAGRGAIPSLLTGLRDPKGRIDRIAEALAQVGRHAFDPLTEALASTDPRLRRGAALALGRARPPAPGIVAKLTPGLADPDAEVRGDFLVAIGYLGPRAAEAVPSIRSMLQDPSPANRGRAIEVLSASAPRGEDLMADLMPRLTDDNDGVRRRALDAIRALGPPGRKALAAAIDLLASRDPDVRLSAAQLVESHGQGAAEAIPALIPLLADPVPKLRILAATTLGKAGKSARPAFDPLASMLGDPLPEIREAAVAALGGLELDAETLRPPLARALRDDKAEVRRAATRSVQRLGPQGALFLPDILRMASSKENTRTVDRLLRPFEKLGPDARSVPELVELLDHEPLPVRLLAIKFLGLARGNAKGAIPALERAGDDPNDEIRKQAKAACEQIKAGP